MLKKRAKLLETKATQTLMLLRARNGDSRSSYLMCVLSF